MDENFSSSVTRVRRPFRDPTDRELLWLAVPAFGSLVAEPLYLLGDAAIVGTLGTEPLAGLGAAATVLTTVVGLCTSGLQHDRSHRSAPRRG